MCVTLVTANLRGTWFICPTPFTQTGELDEGGLGSLVDSVRRWGVDGITILGVMGEASALSDQERGRVLDTVAASAGASLPVAVGCSSSSVRITKERAEQAAAAGAAALMISAPPLLADTDQIGKYFAECATEADIPVIVQDEPNATGVRLPVSAILAALDGAGSTTVKLEDPPTPTKITRLLRARPGVSVFGGLGGQSAHSELSRGAVGTMTGFAFPEILRAVREAIAAGERARAARIFDSYLPYIAFEAQVGVGLAIRKEVLRRRGAFGTSRTRNLSPLLDPLLSEELDDVLDRVGLVPSSSALELD